MRCFFDGPQCTTEFVKSSLTYKSLKNYTQTLKIDYMLFAYVLSIFFWQLIDKLKQTINQ